VTQAQWLPVGLRLVELRSGQTKLLWIGANFSEVEWEQPYSLHCQRIRFAQNNRPREAHAWDAGQLTHLLPTVSDTPILIKASFSKPLSGAPVLRVGSMRVQG
jgi:hypothetical protein